MADRENKKLKTKFKKKRQIHIINTLKWLKILKEIPLNSIIQTDVSKNNCDALTYLT